jgi:hypothetical protein
MGANRAAVLTEMPQIGADYKKADDAPASLAEKNAELDAEL